MYEAEELYKTIVDNLCEGIVVVDRDGVVLFWSTGAERITGYSSAEVVGRNSDDGIPAREDEAGTALRGPRYPLAKTIVDGLPREGRVVLRHKDGHRVPVCTRPVALRGDGGEITGALESFVEVFASARGHSSMLDP